MKLPFLLFSDRTSRRISLYFVPASFLSKLSFCRNSGYSSTNIWICVINYGLAGWVKSSEYISTIAYPPLYLPPLLKVIKLFRPESFAGFIKF